MPVLYMPGVIGNKLRYFYWKKRLNQLGKSSIIDVGVQIINPEWVSIGSNSHIDKFVILGAGEPYKGKRVLTKESNSNFNGKRGELLIGDNVHVAPFALINAMGEVFIGNNSGVASGARIFSASHHYKNIDEPSDYRLYKFGPYVPEKEQCLIIGAVVIKDNAALGLNSVVLPGSTIGENSWVGVMSSVNGEIPPNVIAWGVPARIMKKRLIE